MSSIKATFKCPHEQKQKFANSTCLMTISVGQIVHEGDKFEACVNLVSKSFKTCTILVDDSLQRYSMAIDSDLSPEELYKQSITEGDLWLERNKHIYQKMQNLEKIFRWDDWLNHPHYHDIYTKIDKLYNTEPDYKRAIDHTATIFINRYTTRYPEKIINYENAISLSINFLKEECASFCLWVERKYNFEIYPSKRNLAMTATHLKFIEPYYPDILLPVAIKLKHKSTQVINHLSTSDKNEFLSVV